MPLSIQTTGLEQYAPGGNARVKVLVIGGPGAGKTRWASFFPKPIYADVEAGLASVADRKVPFASVRHSQDMLDLLEFLKQENRQPWENRKYQTVVIDTLDAFQRKVKNEWMEAERKQVFTGWDAWGYLNAKMGLLMTRLLNLDMNVIVNVHYKDKTIKDDETGRETHELMLQLQGETADTAFNDFDLVGWMGTYWEAVDGQKVEKRGLTFKRTADKPFLKDRLHVTPPWMEVTFADTDYSNLFSRINEKVAALTAGEAVGEIPTSGVEQIPSAGVVSPAAAGSGPVAPQTPAEPKLSDHDKPTLQTMARERGLAFKANTLKGELITLIEEHDSKAAEPKAEEVETPASVPETKPAEEKKDETPQQSEAVKALEAAPQPRIVTEQGLVNPQTGELVEPVEDSEPEIEPDPTMEQAVQTAQDTLGGTVIEESKDEAVQPAPPQTIAQPVPAPVVSTTSGHCDDCDADLSKEPPDIVKLSRIKYKSPRANPVTVGLCANCFRARKAA